MEGEREVRGHTTGGDIFLLAAEQESNPEPTGAWLNPGKSISFRS